jgi:nucleoside-diphosphate-sugar epimerase
MKVVLTGSQGFIGGFIVEELLSQGHTVIGIDNFSKYGHLDKQHDRNPNFKLIVEDLSISNKLLKQALIGADHLIAGAAKIGGISYFHTFAYDLLSTNERITANTCDAAIDAYSLGQLKKVTYISSSMVYENTTQWPSKEGDQHLISPPSSAYGFQKLAVEYFAYAAWDQYKLPYTIVRPFNAVGIGEARAIDTVTSKTGNTSISYSHIVPDLIQKVLLGQDPLRLLGNGKQIRHFTYGGDLARGIHMAMLNPAAHNNDFNISTDESFTALEVAELIWYKINKDKPFNFEVDEPFKFDVQQRIPDTSKAKEILGFSAETKLEKVLDELIPWVAESLKKNSI